MADTRRETERDERTPSAPGDGTGDVSSDGPPRRAAPNLPLFYTVLAGALVVSAGLVIAWPNLLGNPRYLALVALTPLLGGAAIALMVSRVHSRLPTIAVNGVRVALAVAVVLDLAAFALPIFVSGATGRDRAPAFVTPNAQATQPATSATAAASPVSFTGQFDPRSGSHGDSVSGTAILGVTTDGSVVLRLQNLKATNGPDLYVYVSKVASPTSTAQVMNGIEVGKLKATSGDSNYSLPAGTRIGDYKAVAVYCKSFSTLFGYANLA